MFGLPAAQALFADRAQAAVAGGVTIEKVSSQVSGRCPDRATGPEPSSPTVALVALAVGVVFGAVIVIVTVADGESAAFPSVTL